jgi:hypothetical protein
MAQEKSFAVFKTVERPDRNKVLAISLVTAVNLPESIAIKYGSIFWFLFSISLPSPLSAKVGQYPQNTINPLFFICLFF